jgi:hypothetical protein
VIPALDRGGFFASTSKKKTKQRLAWTLRVGRVAKHLPWSLFQKEDQPEDFFSCWSRQVLAITEKAIINKTPTPTLAG